jgi:hypothetical protein
MLSSFCCSMTCLKWLRLLNEPLKKSCVVFYYVEAFIWFSPWCFIRVDLAHAYNMFDSYKVAISLYDHLVFDLSYHFMLLLMMSCHYAWLWPLMLSYLVAPRLLLALICTEYELYSCIQLPKTKLFQCVHYKFLCMVFASHSK